MGKSHEIIIGLVGGIKADLESLKADLELSFKRFDYKIEHIKITEFFDFFSKNNEIKNIFKEAENGGKIDDIKSQDEIKKLNAKISLGNTLRKFFERKDILACLAVAKINSHRLKSKENFKTVYIIDQLKTVEEFKILRKVYGRSLFLIGAFEDENSRKDKIKGSEEEQKKLIERDFKENDEYGQKVSDLFPLAHFFVDINNKDRMKVEIDRLVSILFNYPFHTPTIDESCMFLAKGVAARSADLNRQVGVVIADAHGNIISVGWNDVPKVGGNLYKEEDFPDLRDFRLGCDPNKKQIEEILTCDLSTIQKIMPMSPQSINSDIKSLVEKSKEIDYKLKEKLKEILSDDKQDDKKTSEIIKEFLKGLMTGDLLEYSRCLHAELAAICDAARRGVSLLDTTLYCTTFPCHMCAKHILAVGIKRVVFIDPYPKSKVKELFPHTIGLCKEYSESGKLIFESFIGIAPRRFLHLFHKDDREDLVDKNGKVIPWPYSDKNKNMIIHLRNRTALNFIFKEISMILSLKEIFSKNKITISNQCDIYDFIKEIINCKEESLICKLLNENGNFKDAFLKILKSSDFCHKDNSLGIGHE